MLDLNVVHLKNFYETPLGFKVRAILARETARFLNEARDECVLALGYPLPALTPEITKQTQLMVVMPATLGAISWPTPNENRVVMAHDTELPLRESSIHRILALHALEHSESLPHMLEEISQTLSPMGKILLLVPHRLGLWSHSAKSPFGYGTPFRLAHMKSLLAEHGLTVVRARSCLYSPPGHSRLLISLLSPLEWVGRFFLPGAGGVLVVEAQKQIPAGITQPIRRYRPARVGRGVVATFNPPKQGEAV